MEREREHKLRDLVRDRDRDIDTYREERCVPKNKLKKPILFNKSPYKKAIY